MTDDKLNTSLSANTILAKLTNHLQRDLQHHRLTIHLTDFSLDCEDDFRSGCRNASHQQQLFSELLSPGRSHYIRTTDTPGFKPFTMTLSSVRNGYYKEYLTSLFS